MLETFCPSRVSRLFSCMSNPSGRILNAFSPRKVEDCSSPQAECFSGLPDKKNILSIYTCFGNLSELFVCSGDTMSHWAPRNLGTIFYIQIIWFKSNLRFTRKKSRCKHFPVMFLNCTKVSLPSCREVGVFDKLLLNRTSSKNIMTTLHYCTKDRLNHVRHKRSYDKIWYDFYIQT